MWWILLAPATANAEPPVLVQVVARAPIVSFSDSGAPPPLAGPMVRVGTRVGPVIVTGGAGVYGAVATRGGLGGYGLFSLAAGAQPQVWASPCGRTRVRGLVEPEIGVEFGRYSGGSAFSEIRPWVTAGGSATHWLSERFGLGAEAGVRIGFAGSGTSVVAGLTGTIGVRKSAVDLAGCPRSRLLEPGPGSSTAGDPPSCADFVATSITFDSLDPVRPGLARVRIENRGTCDAWGRAALRGVASESTENPAVHPKAPDSRLFIPAGGAITVDYEIEQKTVGPHQFRGCGRALTPADRNNNNNCTEVEVLSGHPVPGLAPPEPTPTAPEDTEKPELYADFLVDGIWTDVQRAGRRGEVRVRVYNAGSTDASGYAVLRAVATEGLNGQPFVDPPIHRVFIPAFGTVHVDFEVEGMMGHESPWLFRACARAVTPADANDANNCRVREPRMVVNETFPFPVHPERSKEEGGPEGACADFRTTGVWVEHLFERRPARVRVRIHNQGTCTAAGSIDVHGMYFEGGNALRNPGRLPIGPIAPGQSIYKDVSMTTRHTGPHIIRACATAAGDTLPENDCLLREFNSGTRMP